MDDKTSSLTFAAAGQAVGLFTALMPPFQEVRQGDSPHLKDGVRTAEITASVVACSIGFGAALVAGNATPFVATLIICLALAGTYEFILSTTPNITEGITHDNAS